MLHAYEEEKSNKLLKRFKAGNRHIASIKLILNLLIVLTRLSETRTKLKTIWNISGTVTIIISLYIFTTDFTPSTQLYIHILTTTFF